MLLIDYIKSNPSLIFILTIVSVVSFVSSLIIIPIIIIKMPCDYFLISHKEYVKQRVKHPVLRILVHIIKNILGIVFILFGLVMLFMPGQGILTTLLGITFLDFPFKRSLEIKIISQQKVLLIVNAIRSKAHKTELLVE